MIRIYKLPHTRDIGIGFPSFQRPVTTEKCECRDVRWGVPNRPEKGWTFVLFDI